ncbi:MAG: hypothetical protein ACLSAH_04970 [Bilophila wadsworthia]
MEDQKRYDWEPSVRKLGETEMLPETAWQEEWQISPDCESFAAVSALEDGTFTVRLNGALWETRTDKMYNCQFAPDGRLTALSQSDGEWAIVVDDAESEEHADYFGEPGSTRPGPSSRPCRPAWNTDAGRRRAVGTALHRRHRFRPFGNRQTAAVVQTGFGQADLEGFSKASIPSPSTAKHGRVLPERVVALFHRKPPGRQHRARHAVRIYHFHQRPALSKPTPVRGNPSEPKSGDVIAHPQGE